MFEVQDLRYATLATVSRCGMVWFSESVLSLDIIFEHFLNKLRNIPTDEAEDETQSWKSSVPKSPVVKKDEILSPTLQVGCTCTGPELALLAQLQTCTVRIPYPSPPTVPNAVQLCSSELKQFMGIHVSRTHLWLSLEMAKIRP